MDLQERQEEALDSKDKTKNIKEKNSKEKKLKNSSELYNILITAKIIVPNTPFKKIIKYILTNSILNKYFIKVNCKPIKKKQGQYNNKL